MERAGEGVGSFEFAHRGLRRPAHFEPNERGLGAVGLGHIDRATGFAVDEQRAFALERPRLSHLEAQLALSTWHGTVGADEVVAVDEVVVVNQVAVADVECVAAAPVALGDEHAFGPGGGNVNLGGDGIRAVADVRCGRAGDSPGAGPQLPMRPRGNAVGIGADEAVHGVVHRQHLVGARLGEPAADHLGQLLGLFRAEVVQFVEVFVQVVELPLVGIEGGAGLMPGDRLPASVPDAAMAEHLEILALLLRWLVRCGEAVGETGPFKRLLGDPTDRGRWPDAGQFEDGRSDVRDVVELLADAAPVHDQLRIVDDQRVANAAAVGVLLVALERRVAGHRPAQGIVVVQVALADLVDVGEVLFQRVAHAVEVAQRIDGAEGRALLACAVVRDQGDDRVFELAGLREEAQQAADLEVGVFEHPGEGGLQADGQSAFVVAQICPGADAGVTRWQRRLWRDNAESLLLYQPPFTGGVPALFEHRHVLLDELGRRVVRGVLRAQAHVEEERFARRHRLLLANEPDRLVDDVFRKVIAVVVRRLNVVVVHRQFGVPLVRFAFEEAVVPVETALQGPLVVGAGG